MQGRDEDIRRLYDDESDAAVHCRNTEYVAPLELGEEPLVAGSL
jgi:hypothetical protein